MLTRTEILLELRKMGVNGFGDLKRCCRNYEIYMGVRDAKAFKRPRTVSSSDRRQAEALR